MNSLRWIVVFITLLQLIAYSQDSLKVSTWINESRELLIVQTFDNWKLEHEQVDDVAVIGLRFN